MIKLLPSVLLLAGSVVLAAPAPEQVITGVVAETMDAGSYTYVRLTQGQESLWLASPQTKAVVGKTMTFQSGAVMKDFKSKTLKRTFPSIVFSPGPVGGPSSGKGHGGMMGGHGGMMAGHGSSSVEPEVGLKVAKADGPDAYTVAELHAKRKELEGKVVSVRGKVIRVSAEIMDRNWVHLQDGTGDSKAGTRDITVTTKALPKAGEVVLIKGKVAADRDIGAGYVYPVLVEDAVVK